MKQQDEQELWELWTWIVSDTDIACGYIDVEKSCAIKLAPINLSFVKK